MSTKWLQSHMHKCKTTQAGRGKTMHSSAKRLRAAIGTCSPVKLFARCLLTGAVLLMSLPARPQASLLESAPLTLATKTQPGSDNMPYTPPIKSMTSEQQHQMLAIAEVGLRWVSGQIDFEDVKRAYGQPEDHWVDNEIGYA